MVKRQVLVVANWKMNGTFNTITPLISAVIQGMQDISNEVAICPPFVYLPELASELNHSTVKLGAQNVSQFEQGAHTGEIAASMLNDFKCEYVLVGHSERRTENNETDTCVANKFIAVQSNEMTPILCVGESLQEREAGSTEEVIARQMDSVLERFGINVFNNAVVAYEPIWAIGTGETATPVQAQEVHEFIRARLTRHDKSIANKTRLLYGGSVKADNAKQLFNMPDIDGGLIGGASLIAEDFLTICKA